ncbi:MAG: prepilin peptidase [Eubacterium sp.]|nr:prepilin peptidase [Eubacterium sp.]
MLQVILTIAVISDIRSDKIPNRLIAVSLGGGIIWRVGIMEVPWYQVALGIGFPICICFFLFLMHALGAGDIKLFSVIGCIWPFTDMALCMLLSFVAGAVISISKLLIHKQFFESLSCFYHYFQTFYQTGKIEKYPGRDVKQRQMHFSVAIYIGFFLTLGVTYGKVFDSFM